MSEERQGYMRVYYWVQDALEDDYKALGVYAYLLGKQWGHREPFQYLVNNRTYDVLAGQHMTSLRRIMKQFGTSLKTTKRIIDKLIEINAVHVKAVFATTAKQEKVCDGIIITFLTPFIFVNTPDYEMQQPPISENIDPRCPNETLSYNYSLSKSIIKKEESANACARASTSPSEDHQRLPGEVNMFDEHSAQEPKNIPPEPLDDPNDIRFDLDQRFDPRVRQSVWRQLAVDWYYWASDNGRWRALTFTKYIDCVRAMIDSGEVDDVTLREMFDKIIKTNPFWQRNFKRIDKWNSYFSTGETRLSACLNDLKSLNNQSNSNKKQHSPIDDEYDKSFDEFLSSLK